MCNSYRVLPPFKVVAQSNMRSLYYDLTRSNMVSHTSMQYLAYSEIFVKLYTLSTSAFISFYQGTLRALLPLRTCLS